VHPATAARNNQMPRARDRELFSPPTVGGLHPIKILTPPNEKMARGVAVETKCIW